MSAPATPPHRPGQRTPPRRSLPASPTSPSSASHAHHTSYQSFADIATPSSHSHTPAHTTRIHPGRAHDTETAPDEDGLLPTTLNRTKNTQPRKKDKLTTLDLVKMTVGIAGAQLAWTVEMAYGTPYLLSLGLTKQGTSLVWMAGPLSGLLVQPIVGALSDSSPSRFRRRQYILYSTLLILLSTLIVAFARELATVICSAVPFLGGAGDWDPANERMKRRVAIWLGVVGFYGLDFALNGLQASLRALVLDLSPPGSHSLSNAWLGRQTHLANILGYLLGYFDLGHSSFPLLRWIGGGQFRKLAVLACVVMVGCVGVTCWTQEETARPRLMREGEGRESAWRKLKGVGRDVARSIRTLPLPVRRVCYVQFFAWTAWFPFLFYATTYVSETLYASLPPHSPSSPSPSYLAPFQPQQPSSPPRPPIDPDAATRLGSFALLLYALISLAAGSLIPYLTTLGSHHPSLPARLGPLGRRVLVSLTPRNCWTVGLAWYAVDMAATFWVRGVRGAIAVVALAGVPWAITCWVPFALVMESIRELDAASSPSPSSPSPSSSASPTPARAASPAHRKPTSSLSRSRDLRTPFRAKVGSLRQASFTVPHSHARVEDVGSSSSSPAHSPARVAANERTGLLAKNGGRGGEGGEDGELEGEVGEKPRPSGGTLLGIHNLAVVLPQFFVALVAALIFKLASSSRTPSFLYSPPPLPSLHSLPALSSAPPASTPEVSDVVWVLRFGGLAALVGAVVSWYGVLETESERRYRWWVLYGWEAEEGREGEEGGAED
ncbi:hypothetical protein JCM8097_000197 [Rhodosporidiobolus ruineniae]